MIQNYIAITIGIVACLYVVKTFIGQLKKTEFNPKCDNCPIPGLMKNSKELQ